MTSEIINQRFLKQADILKSEILNKQSEEVISRLPGDLRELAKLIGLDATLLVVERWRGTYIEIPKCEALIREIRDNEIRDHYDNAVPVRTLALRYNLTVRQITNILGKSNKDVPLPLLSLMKSK